jgi:hypothetical protein
MILVYIQNTIQQQLTHAYNQLEVVQKSYQQIEDSKFRDRVILLVKIQKLKNQIQKIEKISSFFGKLTQKRTSI